MTQLDTRAVKTLLNVIRNVLDNTDFRKRFSSRQIKILKPYKKTYDRLLDDRVRLSDKRKLLQKEGDTYLPTFLDIIGEELEDCQPIERRRRDCPLCGKENLVKLSNHLADMHHLTREERRQYLRSTDT